MSARIEELPYFEDSAALFGPWADRRWAVFLDSGFPHCRHGRYDIIAADPIATLVTRGHVTEIRRCGEAALSPADPFSLLRRELGAAANPFGELPFAGGALGYFGYDLARRLEKLPEQASDAENIADMAVGIYDWAVVVDHLQGRSWLVGQGRTSATAARWPHLVRSFSQIQTIGWQRTGFDVLAPVQANMTRREYFAAFKRIQEYIREGDCYQVNLAQRFAAPCRGNAWSLYQTLRQANPAPFGAFINSPQARILSSSPERFLRVLDGKVETKPIKGTRPRSADPAEDRRLAAALQGSEKDRAENLMIVDLLRNDIGKHCRAGSVSAPKLFDVESYATVHHLVSTITGELTPDHDAVSLLRDSFPGGSITGAPKIRSMEIIEELEPNRRGVYCGAIGYLGFDGNMDTNIAIRTLVHADNTIRFWAGGGIVADSSAESEYQECFDKAAALLNQLERFRIARTGDHVGR